MKCMVIKGSYHKKGNIASLVDSFAKGFKKGNNKNKIEIIDLQDKKINFCKGCSKCFIDDGNKIGNCSQKDDMRKIIEKSLESDVLILASPIYEHYMTALMKKFIERSAPILFSPKKAVIPIPRARNKSRKEKTGIVFLSSGAPYPINYLMGFTGHAKKILNIFARGFGCGKRITIQAGGMENQKIKKKFLNKSYILGMKNGSA